MKKTTLLTLAAIAGLMGTAFAEGKGGGGNGFLDAAAKYDQQAWDAMSVGDLDKAEIYSRLADIKREAAAASEKGEGYSWDEYHALAAKLHGGKKGHDHKKDGKKHEHKKDKKDNGFLRTAALYEKRAAQAKANGNNADAKIFRQLAQMKKDAAAGKKVDWKDYHKLKGQLSFAKKHDHKKHDHKKNHRKPAKK